MQRTQVLSLIAVAALSGAGGYFAGRSNEPPGDIRQVGRKAPEGKQVAPVPGSTLPASLTKLRGEEPLTAANASALTFRALEESDPNTRMAATTLLLESMTPENARAIRQAFLDITSQTGRQNPGEWALMVQRFGAVLGAQAIKEFADSEHNVALAIEGFASVDSAAAMAAIKEAGLEGGHITNAWLAGICRKDPGKAILLALNGGYDGVNGGPLLQLAIQSAGIEGAREALQRALDDPSANAGSPDTFTSVFEALAGALAHKYTTTGTPGEMLKWLEQQKDQPYVSDKLISNAAYENLLKGDPAATVAWLERMNTGAEGVRVGTARIFDAVIKEPAVLNKLDDASFARLVPLMEKDTLKLQVLASMLDKTNPPRAQQVRAITPAPPPLPVPVPGPVPAGEQ